AWRGGSGRLIRACNLAFRPALPDRLVRASRGARSAGARGGSAAGPVPVSPSVGASPGSGPGVTDFSTLRGWSEGVSVPGASPDPYHNAVSRAPAPRAIARKPIPTH